MKSEPVELEARWNVYSLQTVARPHVCAICGATTLQAAEDGWRWRWKSIEGKRGRFTDVRCPTCYADEWKREHALAVAAVGCLRCGSTDLTHDVVGESTPRVTCNVCAWHHEGGTLPGLLSKPSPSRLHTMMMASLATLASLLLWIVPAQAQWFPATRITARANLTTTTAAQLVYAGDETRRNVVCFNRHETVGIRLGPSTVTATTGIVLPALTSITFANATYAIYAVAESTGSPVLSCGADFR